jgi:hypothetical protein
MPEIVSASPAEIAKRLGIESVSVAREGIAAISEAKRAKILEDQKAKQKDSFAWQASALLQSLSKRPATDFLLEQAQLRLLEAQAQVDARQGAIAELEASVQKKPGEKLVKRSSAASPPNQEPLGRSATVSRGLERSCCLNSPPQEENQ